MLVKRQEKDNIIKAIYKSSNILASTYDKTTSDLILIFNKGTQYKYPKVTSSDYNRLELSESQGKVFNTHIKPYSFEKLGDIDPAAILAEVESIDKANQLRLTVAKQVKFINKMKDLIEYTNDPTTIKLIGQKQIDELQIIITEYTTELAK